MGPHMREQACLQRPEPQRAWETEGRGRGSGVRPLRKSLRISSSPICSSRVLRRSLDTLAISRMVGWNVFSAFPRLFTACSPNRHAPTSACCWLNTACTHTCRAASGSPGVS